MEIYLSPIYVILAGIFIVGIFNFMKIPNAFIASLALAICLYTIYLHISTYTPDYRSISTSAWLQSLAPTILIGVVIFMSIAYIIYFLKKGKSYKDSIIPEIQSPKISKPQNSLKNISRSLTDSEQRNYISALDRLI